ncbi:hypothetical protein U1Q18_002827 [Sarracenia purpurea var. burkii]
MKLPNDDELVCLVRDPAISLSPGRITHSPIHDSRNDDLLLGEGEDTPQAITDNGKIESKDGDAKPSANKGKAGKPESSAKPKVTVVEPKKDDKSDEDDESDEDESDDKDMMEASDDTDDSEDEDDSDDSDDSEDEDEETPKKADPGQKRPAESATKTPVPAKKKQNWAHLRRQMGRRVVATLPLPTLRRKLGKLQLIVTNPMSRLRSLMPKFLAKLVTRPSTQKLVYSLIQRPSMVEIRSGIQHCGNGFFLCWRMN